MIDTPKMVESKSNRILELISLKGAMTFRDIQRALWEMSHPGVPFTRAQRGYWCTNLLGGRFYHKGLLHTFCVKGHDGLWRYMRSQFFRHPWSYVNGTSVMP